MTEQHQLQQAYKALWVQVGHGLNLWLGPGFVWMEPKTGASTFEPMEILASRN